MKCLDKTNSTIEDDMLLLLPHMLFSSLANNYVERFHDLFPGEGLETFWEQTLATRDDRVGGSPLEKRAAEEEVAPLVIHGDGVAYESRDSLMTWSFGSLLASDKPSTDLMICRMPSLVDSTQPTFRCNV